jgi:putative lipoprotein
VRGALAAIALAAVLVPTVARADDDPWTGGDKSAHFVVSAGIAAGGYGAGTALFEERAHAVLFALGVTLAAGFAKEGLDLAGFGQASWKDLAWDGLGMATGLFLVWSLDFLLVGPKKTEALRLRQTETNRGGIAF